ncbi:hypothetical protein C8R44DRAFT_822848, partial [Mycena epipterygia]
MPTAFKLVQVLFNFILHTADLTCRGHLGHTPRIAFRFGSRTPIPPRLSQGIQVCPSFDYPLDITDLSLDAGLRDVYNVLPSREHTLPPSKFS